MTIYLAPACSECNSNKQVSFVKGNVIYPYRLDLYEKFFWLCDCGAYVGCHGQTGEALGFPAAAYTRALRMQVHELFDKLWKTGSLTRKQAYAKMGEALGITKDECHVGRFTSEQCFKALAWLKGAGIS